VPTWIAIALVLAAVAVALEVARAGRGWRRRSSAPLAAAGYASPAEADAALDALAHAHSACCAVFELGRSAEGRPLRGLRLRAGAPGPRPRLLVTAHIHAIEYIGGHVARALASRLASGFGFDPTCTRLLERAEVVIVPLLNPDGAERIWRAGGYTRLGGARFTARGVDPNRNFPVVPAAHGDDRRRAWNSARARPGSVYYTGPHPLSEPECAALAALAGRERYHAALHFHSFGCVVYMPDTPPGSAARRALDVFDGPFQSRQRRPYRAVRERAAAIEGQLDPYLLAAFGTPSVTIEVGMPTPGVQCGGRLGNLFWIANPPRPERWVENDVAATVHALDALLDATLESRPAPTHPDLGHGLVATPSS